MKNYVCSIIFLVSLFGFKTLAQDNNSVSTAITIDSFPYTVENFESEDGGSATGMQGSCFTLPCCSVKVFKVVLPAPGYLRVELSNYTPLSASIIAYSSDVENPTDWSDLTYESHPGNFCGFRDTLQLGRPDWPTGSQFGAVGPGTYYDEDTYYILAWVTNNQIDFTSSPTDLTFTFTPDCPEGASCTSVSYSDCNGVPYTSPTGNIYSESGSYVDTLYNANSMGGDSIIYTSVAISEMAVTETTQNKLADNSCSVSGENTQRIANTDFVSYGEFVKADGDWVEIDEVAPEIASLNRSVSAWIKHPNQVSGSSQIIVGMNTSGTSTVSNFLIGTNEKVGVYDGGNYRYTNTIITDGEWHHVAYTYNEGSNSTKIYIDGVLERTYTNGQTIATNGRVSIGQEYDGSSTGNYFDGFITEVSIWKEELSESEVQLLMEAAIDESHPQYEHLVAYYNMNPVREGCDTNLADIKDSSTNALHGVASNDILSVSEYEQISGFNSAKHFNKSWTYNGSVVATSDTLTVSNTNLGTYNLELERDHLFIEDSFEMNIDGCLDFEWAFINSGTWDNYAEASLADGNGNVYVVGSFSSIVDFDPETSVSTLNAGTFKKIYIQKLNMNKELVWAKMIETNSADTKSVQAFTLDDDGNIYIGGSFNNAVDFDPGPGNFTMGASFTVNNYIVKLDNDGNFIWATNEAGAAVKDIQIDSAGNVYALGVFSNTEDLDAGSGTYSVTSNGNDDIYLKKLDSDGNFIWAKTIGATEQEKAVKLSIDHTDHILLTGSYRGTVDLNPNAGVQSHTYAGEDDTFIEKLDSDGNFIWAKTFGSSGTELPSAIATDSSGNVYTIGVFANELDFDPSDADHLITPQDSDIFVLKLDSNGDFDWVKTWGGIGAEKSGSIFVDNDNNIYWSGAYLETIETNDASITLVNTTDYYNFNIEKLDNKGDYLWSHQIENNNTLADASVDDSNITSISTDTWGNVFVSGHVETSADFNPSGDPYELSTGEANKINSFVLRLSNKADELPKTYYATNGGSGMQNGYSKEHAAASLNTFTTITKANDNIVVFDGVLNESTDITIHTGVNLLVEDGATVNMNSSNLTNNGVFTINSTAALVQNTGSELYGSGVFKIKRTAGNNTALFNFLSSPIDNIDVRSVFSGSNCVAFAPEDQSNGLNGWTYILTENLLNGHGYAVNGSNNEDATGTRTFTGMANNGTIDVSLNGQTYGGGYDGWNLLGNPYPSALNMKNFIDNNTDVGAVTFYDQSAGMYVTYNTINADGLYIPSGQGFFVEFSTANSGIANFTNSMRSETAGTIERSAAIDKLTLRIANNNGEAYETLLAFLGDATDAFDKAYDAKLIPAANELTVFSRLYADNYSIQGFATIQESKTIPLGMESLGGETSIAIAAIEFGANMSITLIDHQEAIEHDLTKGDYSFIAEEGINTSRFAIRIDRKKLPTEENVLAEMDVVYNDKQITISTNEDIEVHKLILFDITGKFIAQYNQVQNDTNKAYINISEQANAIYLLEIHTDKGTYHKKVYLK